MTLNRKFDLPEKLTFFMNCRSSDYQTFQKYVQSLNEKGLITCCLPTSGCDTLWIRKKEGAILTTLYGPTAINHYFSNLRR